MAERSASEAGEPLEPEEATTLSLAAFTRVVEAQQGPLYGFLRGMAPDAEQARDLLQDAFHDAWRATRQATPPWTTAQNDDDRRRWLFHAAYCRAVSLLRRRKIIHWIPLEWPRLDQAGGSAPDLADSAAPFDERLVEAEALREALAKLSPEDAACLLLRAAQGFSASEAAVIMGISPEAMAQRISRARRRLRAIYEAQNPAEGRRSGPGERSGGDA